MLVGEGSNKNAHISSSRYQKDLDHFVELPCLVPAHKVSPKDQFSFPLSLMTSILS